MHEVDCPAGAGLTVVQGITIPTFGTPSTVVQGDDSDNSCRQVEVVEVKSKGDTISKEQKAWLVELEDIGVPAMVARVVAENEAVPNKRSRTRWTKVGSFVPSGERP